MNKITYNFSSGPAVLPKSVLLEVKNNLLNWKNTGSSIVEVSHRSNEFLEIVEESEKNIRDLLNISQDYVVLFCPGGARGQFSAIPLNLSKFNNTTDYIDSGYWSYSAMLEAKKYCLPNHINVKNIKNNKICITPMKNWRLSDYSDYMHFCPNETIEGVAIHEEPNFKNKIIIGDFSSCILSKPININKYDLIYASAQKNIGPAGITIVILKKELLNNNNNNIFLPSILNYKKIFANQSMFNTPSTFSWYVSHLVFKWMKKKGGLNFFNKNNYYKAKLLYKKIDESDFYINNIHTNNRSYMNVTFNLHDFRLNECFLQQSSLHSLNFLRGHKIVGGLRASIYNAMPINGVIALVDFMKYFEKKFG